MYPSFITQPKRGLRLREVRREGDEQANPQHGQLLSQQLARAHPFALAILRLGSDCPPQEKVSLIYGGVFVTGEGDEIMFPTREGVVVFIFTTANSTEYCKSQEKLVVLQ